MKNNLINALQFIEDQDKKFGDVWSVSTDGLAATMVDYAVLTNRIKQLDWIKPNVLMIDDGYELAWIARPTPEIKYQITAGTTDNKFEAWAFPEDNSDDWQFNSDDWQFNIESVHEAKQWCEKHWLKYASEQIKKYIEE